MTWRNILTERHAHDMEGHHTEKTYILWDVNTEGTYTRRQHIIFEGIKMEGIYARRGHTDGADIQTKEAFTYKDIHTEKHIHEGDIRMKRREH